MWNGFELPNIPKNGGIISVETSLKHTESQNQFPTGKTSKELSRKWNVPSLTTKFKKSHPKTRDLGIW